MGDKHGKIDGEMGRERGIHTQIYIYIYIVLGSSNGDTPKWMVYRGKSF